jgi:integrase
MQRGVIVKRRQSWTLFYYDVQYRDGKKKRVRVSKKLASLSEYPSKSSVRHLADEILAPLNRKQLQPESSLKVTEYIEDHYFPAVKTELRPSTYKGYKDFIYETHLKDRLDAIKLRDFRSVHAQKLLRQIPDVGHRTLLHIKSFLSGVFKFAKREGVLDGQNPLVDVTVPGRPEKFKGAAYDLDDAARILEDLEPYEGQSDKERHAYETASDVVALLSFTGLRQSECRGLRWSDWDERNQTLRISRGVWQTHVGPTKNPASEDTIPVLPLLRELLQRRRVRVNPKLSDYIFAGERRGTPLNLHNLENRVIKPAIERVKLNGEVGVQWFGFHGFRRGLASNLLSLGTDPRLVAAILRHSDVSTTLQFYSVTTDKQARAAMDKLEDAIRNRPTDLSVD